MKRLVLIFYLVPFMLLAQSDLPYDYIDDNTKMSKELSEYNNYIKMKNKQRKKELDKKEREPSGFIFGAGGTIAYAIGARDVANESSAHIGRDYGFDILSGYK